MKDRGSFRSRPSACSRPPPSPGRRWRRSCRRPSHLAFVLLEFDVKDPAAFKELAPKVRATLKDYKGEFVMREKVDSLFGGKAANLSVISFPTVEDARKWLDSPEIAKLKARARQDRRRAHLPCREAGLTGRQGAPDCDAGHARLGECFSPIGQRFPL